VASPANDPQQQQQQDEVRAKCLRRESQPPEGTRYKAPQPLRTALSVPLPAKTVGGRQAPLHPYMQYYQQQVHEQQQRQQKQQLQRPQEAQPS
jgi:hypothetical protein